MKLNIKGILRGILRYLGKILFEEYFILSSLTGASYLVGLVVSFYSKEGKVVFNAIPPLFWPILSASIILAGIGFRVRDYQEDKKRKVKAKHDAYYERVRSTFESVKGVYEITWKDPNNYQLLFTPRLKALEKVRSLHYELSKKEKEKKGMYPIFPQKIDINSLDSIWEWYVFLVDEKARIEMERN